MMRSASSSSLTSLPEDDPDVSFSFDLEMATTEDNAMQLPTIHSLSGSSSNSRTSSSTGSSTPSSSPTAASSTLRKQPTLFLRQRKEISPADNDADAPSSKQIMDRFLAGPHTFDPRTNPPSVAVRKESDFDVQQFLVDQEKVAQATRGGTAADERVTVVRTREQVVLHFLMELRMLKRDGLFILFVTFYQWVHSVMTNVAYYYHTQLTAAQRIPLQDVAFQNLPLLTGDWWMVSEYFVFGMIGTSVALIISILFVRWHPPHGRPLYCIPILRRMGLTLLVTMTLRITSFLVTTLPGASRQCLYHVPDDMDSKELMNGPAHDRGQPDGWAPPNDLNEILWRSDLTTGCGDLMFSSHTIFTMLFVCITCRYFDWKILKGFMILSQIVIIPLILAARKHYSIDVFTALYVVPLVWMTLNSKYPDLDVTSATMDSHYGIRFSLTKGGSYIASVWGKEFYVDPQDLPVDLQKAHYGNNRSRQIEIPMNTSRSEVEPMLV